VAMEMDASKAINVSSGRTNRKGCL
jgi:hypothetical protein